MAISPTTDIERNIDLFLDNTHFCLIWKPANASFNQSVEELTDKFKIVEKFKTEENVFSHFKYEFLPKKIEFHLTNFIVYDLELVIQIKLDLIVFHCIA